MNFYIESIYIGEFDVQSGPLIRYIATNNNDLQEKIQQHFEEWKEFFIPETELTGKFVSIPLGNQHQILSHAIEHRDDKYERKKIVFNVAIIVSKLIYKEYRDSLKFNIEKIANYMLKIEKLHRFLTNSPIKNLINFIDHIFNKLTNDNKVVLLQENNICYLYFEKKIQKQSHIGLKDIILRTKKLKKKMGEYRKTDYFGYIVLINMEGQTLLSDLIFNVFYFLKDRYSQYPKNNFTINRSLEFEIHSSLFSLTEMTAFILEFIEDLHQKNLVFIVESVKNSCFYHFPKHIGLCSSKSYIKMFKDFIEGLEIDLHSFKPQIETLFLFLVNAFQGMVTAGQVLMTLQQGRDVEEVEDLNKFFALFIYFNTLKDKLVKKHEYLYFNYVATAAGDVCAGMWLVGASTHLAFAKLNQSLSLNPPPR